MRLPSAGFFEISRGAHASGPGPWTTGAAYSWNANQGVVTAAGGQYRMCWCAGEHYPCSSEEDFRVDLGRLTLVGPAPVFRQDRTCVAGQSCRFDAITGFHMSTSDSVMVLDTCGAAVLELHNFMAVNVASM